MFEMTTVTADALNLSVNRGCGVADDNWILAADRRVDRAALNDHRRVHAQITPTGTDVTLQYTTGTGHTSPAAQPRTVF